MATHEASRVEMPKPQMFSGKRNAKELNNFLWHIKRYFKAIAIMDKAIKKPTTTHYLTINATLRWRQRFADIEKGTCTIDTWDAFKRKIKRQFYPENVACLARKNMKCPKYTSSIREYVKGFSTLMIRIPSMPTKEQLFNFMNNIQSWAKQELRQQGSKN